MLLLRQVTFVAALLSSTAISQMALAQVADGQAIEEVVVTAQHRTQALQDVPLAVSAITADTLAGAHVSGVQDLSLVSPSVTFAQSTDSLNAAVRIRGIGTQVFSLAIEPSVSFVIDGVVFARQGAALTDLVDIERVEILRGPQSTLFGKNASAGVINVVTKRPSTTPEASLFASVESDGSNVIRGGASGPLSDTVRGRVSAYYNDYKGYIDNLFDGRKLNGSVSWGLKGKLEYEPTEALTVTLGADYRKSDSDCCQSQVDEVFNPRFGAVIAPVVPSKSNTDVFVNAPVYSNTEDWGVSLTADWKLGDATLTSLTAYRDWWNERNADIDAQALPAPLPDIRELNVNGGITTFKTLTQEVRLAGRAWDRLDYVLGVYLYDFKLDVDFDRQSRACTVAGPAGTCATVTPTALNFTTSLHEQNVSAFVDGTYDLTPAFQAFAGLRVAYNDQSVDYIRTGSGPIGPLEGSHSNNATMGRAGLRYAFTPDISAYASYARGVKYGSYDLTSGLTAADFAAQPIDPETSDAYELGLRTEFFARRLTLNATAFRTNYNNFQAQSYDPQLSLQRLVSAGKVRTQGVELEAMARPIRGLSLNAGVSYTDGKITEFPNGPCYVSAALPASCRLGPGGVRLQDLSGTNLPNSPKWKTFISGRYDFETSGPVDVFVTGNVMNQSRVDFLLNHNPRAIQKAYTIVNASVGVKTKDGKTTAEIYARNLFDTNYATLRAEGAVGDPSGIIHYLPREASALYGVSLKRDF